MLGSYRALLAGNKKQQVTSQAVCYGAHLVCINAAVSDDNDDLWSGSFGGDCVLLQHLGGMRDGSGDVGAPIDTDLRQASSSSVAICGPVPQMKARRLAPGNISVLCSTGGLLV